MGDRHVTCCHYQCDDCGKGHPQKYFEEEILSSIVLSISTSIVFSIACYSYILTFVRKDMNNITNKTNMYITRITKSTKFQTCMNMEDHQDTHCHYQCDDCGQDIQENTVRRKYCLIWKFHLHQIHCCIPCQ